MLALGVVAVVACAKPAPPHITWIEDDLAAATAQATSRKLPMFVEAFAPW